MPKVQGIDHQSYLKKHYKLSEDKEKGECVMEKKQILIVVDMQNDFITGALGSDEAKKIVGNVVEAVKQHKGDVYFTRDTHERNYLQTQEGKNLPIEHCIKGTNGWEICSELQALTKEAVIIDKPAFGSMKLAEKIKEEAEKNEIESITLVGLCTDICVISNAMILKAALPEVPVQVIEKCCAGVSIESHKNALEAMKMCQIAVI